MMKKTILLLLAAFCGVLTVAAQDLIIKADASKVEAKVTEITPESVRYKRFSNPDGPTYVLPVSEISYIQYANGEKEYFKAAASIPATPLTPALPAEEPATVSAAPAAAEAPAAEGAAPEREVHQRVPARKAGRKQKIHRLRYAAADQKTRQRQRQQHKKQDLDRFQMHEKASLPSCIPGPRCFHFLLSVL